MITIIGNVTLHGELIVIGCHNAEHAAIDNDLTITRSVFTNTEGALVTQQRTLFDSRTSAIGIVTRHHERTGTALGERSVVQTAFNLGIDSGKTLVVVLSTPGNSVFFADFFLLFGNTDDIIVRIKQNFSQKFLLFSGQTFHGQLLGIIQCKPGFSCSLPGNFFTFTLIKSNLRNVVGPDIQLHCLLVVVKMSEQLTETIHTFFKVRCTPAVTFVNFTFGCGPVLIRCTIRIGMRCRSKHHITNLNSTHILVTGHQNCHCTGHVRSRHGST